jgi:imidazoleglycerol-phosphate dehydratase
MRQGSVSRETFETRIEVAVDLDGKGTAEANTGIGFFDHMFTLVAKHGLFDIVARCKGDLEVDGHHTVEDAGICFGGAIRQALGDKAGIKRYGTFFVPMDEALAMVSVDVSGRPFLVFDASFDAPMCGAFDTQLVEEFFRGVAMEGGLTLHMKVLYGKNDHHKIEALFKAFARALDEATRMDGRFSGIPSTKGVL